MLLKLSAIYEMQSANLGRSEWEENTEKLLLIFILLIGATHALYRL